MTYRVFKTTYTGRDGARRQAAKWYVEFRDQNATVRRLPAFVNKAASEEMGRNLVKLVEYHKATGGQTDPALARWLAGVPAKVREKLVEIGLLDSERVAAAKPLSGHLADFAAALAAKGSGEDHVKTVTGRARRALTGCGFRFYSDISADRVLGFLNDLRADTEGRQGRSAQTFNFYLAAVKQFCRWMVRNRRAAVNPVDHLEPLNVKLDRRRDRRALSEAELKTLVTTTATGRRRGGMAGAERALLYPLAAETGLRSKELRSLTRASFDLDGASPTVTVAAAYSKRRREDTLPLRPKLAAALRKHLAGKAPATPAFRVPRCRKEAAKMFRADVEAAGIAYRDDAGLVADFHALRHTFITNLARSGVHPKVAQALARHSTITLTMDRYSHTLVEELADTLRALPDLSLPVSAEVRATGTAGTRPAQGGPSDLASCLARHRRLGETSGASDGLPGETSLESQHPEVAAVSATNRGSGGVCTAGAGPGLQNQWGV